MWFHFSCRFIAVFLVIVFTLSLNTLQLMHRLPTTQSRIRMAGQSWLTRPVSDRSGNSHITWRYITGGQRLVETIFYQKVDRTGQPVFGSEPRVVWQGYFSLLDHYAQPADGAGAIVPDSKGGAYILAGPWVLRVNQNGRSVWPAGKGYRNRSGSLWRYPSRVRITDDYRENIGSLKFFADGKGGVFAVWRSSKGVRAQRIDSSGRQLWGRMGRALYFKHSEIDRHYGRAVPDGRGGLIALLMCNDFWEKKKPRVVFYSPSGRRGRIVRIPLTIPMVNDSIYRICPDRKGGVCIFHAVLIRRASSPRGRMQELRRIRLCWINRKGRTVFNRWLFAKPVILNRLSVRSMRDGTVLVSWQHKVLSDDPDDAADSLRIRIAAVTAGGRVIRGTAAALNIPLVSGGGRFQNGNSRRDMLYSGGRILYVCDGAAKSPHAVSGFMNSIFYNSLVPGSVYTGATAGQKITGGYGGYYPFLVRPGGRVALVYFGSRRISGVRDSVTPFFRYLP